MIVHKALGGGSLCFRWPSNVFQLFVAKVNGNDFGILGSLQHRYGMWSNVGQGSVTSVRISILFMVIDFLIFQFDFSQTFRSHIFFIFGVYREFV